MSKDKIEVNMNVYDIPIVVEALEEANKEIERLNNIIKEVRNILEPLVELEGIMTAKGMSKLLEILDKGE